MKKIGKIFALILMAGTLTFALAGCSKDSGIPNSKSDQIIYNGGIVSVVDDNIFYANGYSNSDITTMDEFNAAAEYSYLARLNLNENETDPYSSPENVVKLNSEVVGYENTYSFVVGDFVYYASPNKHQTSSNTYVFTYVSLFKTRLNGSDTKELMTTNSFDTEKAQFSVVEVEGQKFWLVYDGTALNIINLNNDKVIKISDSATSVALPKENETFNGKVYYTEDKENKYGETGNEVFEYDLVLNESKAIMKTINNTVTFTGRCGDDVFYTRVNALTNVTKTYKADAKDFESQTFLTAGEEFYSAEISEIWKIESENLSSYNGYIFTSSLSGNAQILYKRNSASNPIVLLASGSYSSLLFVSGDLVYYSTSDGIAYKSVSSPTEETKLVEGLTIIADKIGYDFYESGNLKNLYFYAQRIYLEDDEDSTESTSETEENDDTNYYLYMISASSQSTPQLLGKTVK